MDDLMLTTVQAEFQEDSVLAHAVLNGDADLILSADSDLAALLGGRCVSIKNFTFNDRTKVKSIQAMGVFSAEYSTIQDICGLLGVPFNNIILAKRPVFEGIYCMKVRCLIAVGIGCDVFVNGVPRMTPKVMHKLILKMKQQQKPESDYYGIIMDTYLKNYVIDVKKNHPLSVDLISQIEIDQFKVMIDTFVDCMIYEPCNITNGDGNISTVLFDRNQYINSNYIPTSIHPYLESFARNDTCININRSVEDSEDLSVCIGPGNGLHYYMKKEGSNQCIDCQVVVCKTCTFLNATEIFCVNCFAASNFVSVGDLDASISTVEMVSTLNQQGYQISSSDPVEDIINIYDMVVNKSNSIYSEEILQNVTVPQESPLYLRYLRPTVTFDLTKGATFMYNENLGIQDVISVLDIIQQLVHILVAPYCSIYCKILLLQ
jgi:hypothetical protein